MTMRVSIKDQYMNEFDQFIKTLPSEAVIIKKSLDDEITKRVNDYKSNNMSTSAFGTGLNKIRENLIYQC